MDDVVFGPVVAEQTGELLDLVRRYYAEDGIAFAPECVGPALDRLVRDPALGRAFFITRGERRVGYVIFTFGFDAEFGGRLATITDLFFEPAARRRGLGRATIEFVAQPCRGLGVRGLELQVETHNAAGQALYRRCGFRELPRLPMHLSLD